MLTGLTGLKALFSASFASNVLHMLLTYLPHYIEDVVMAGDSGEHHALSSTNFKRPTVGSLRTYLDKLKV